MSRTRLIASLTAISCCLALVLALAARTFPLKAAPRLAQSALEDGAAPLLQRIEVKHHDFDSATLNDAIVNEEGSRMSQLPGRLTLETAYDQARSENMKKFLEDFWNGLARFASARHFGIRRLQANPFARQTGRRLDRWRRRRCRWRPQRWALWEPLRWNDWRY